MGFGFRVHGWWVGYKAGFRVRVHGLWVRARVHGVRLLAHRVAHRPLHGCGNGGVGVGRVGEGHGGAGWGGVVDGLGGNAVDRVVSPRLLGALVCDLVGQRQGQGVCVCVGMGRRCVVWWGRGGGRGGVWLSGGRCGVGLGHR